MKYRKNVLFLIIILACLNCKKDSCPGPPLFNIAGSGQKAPANVMFEIVSDKKDVTFIQWNFGDGNIQNNESAPSHTYQAAGEYNVVLTIGNSQEGCENLTLTQKVVLLGEVPTAALFTPNVTSCTAPCTVIFSNQSTNATSYLWDFGDGQTSSLTNPSHAYSNPGTYTVILTASGTNGSNTASTTISIQSPQNSGYNCINGNCTFTNNNPAYSSLSACQNNCGSQSSTITFNNNTFTPITIVFGNSTQIAPVGGAATFTGPPGQNISGYASTSGKTSQGNQVGELLSWTLNYPFPNSGNAMVNLNINAEYFFLRLINNGWNDITSVYVNYGLTSQTVDYIIIPTNGVTYNIGYYKAWTNSNVWGCRDAVGLCTVWNQGEQFYLPFAENQSITLENTFFHNEKVLEK